MKREWKMWNIKMQRNRKKKADQKVHPIIGTQTANSDTTKWRGRKNPKKDCYILLNGKPRSKCITSTKFPFKLWLPSNLATILKEFETLFFGFISSELTQKIGILCATFAGPHWGGGVVYLIWPSVRKITSPISAENVTFPNWTKKILK